jgi:hypothetical protein
MYYTDNLTEFLAMMDRLHGGGGGYTYSLYDLNGRPLDGGGGPVEIHGSSNYIDPWRWHSPLAGDGRGGEYGYGGGGGGGRPAGRPAGSSASRGISKTYPTVQQAMKCALWSMLNDLRANNPSVSLGTLLGTGRTEWGGKIFADGNGGFGYSGYTSWSTDFDSPPGTGIGSIRVPNGMTPIGNYHTHTMGHPEGWMFSGADLNRGVTGAPLSNYYYSAIVAPNRYDFTLIGWYPPNVVDDETVSAYEMEINGDGC